MTDPGPGPAGTAAPRGLLHFSVAGRVAPGLFALGWLATLLGAGLAAVGILAGGSGAGFFVFLGGTAGLALGLAALAGSQALERRAAVRPGDAVTWTGPSPVLVVAAAIPATFPLSVLVFVPLGLLGLDPPDALTRLLLVGVQAVVLVGLVQLLVVGPGTRDWATLGLRGPIPKALRDAAWGAVAAAPIILATALLGGVLVSLLGAAPESPLPPTGSTTGLVLNVLAGVVLAPISEEILFRGVAAGAWVGSLGRNGAIIRSALLFALVHVIGVGGATFGEAASLAMVGFLGRLPIGLALGWIFLRSGSLWSSIGLHAAFNLVLLLGAEAALG